MHATSTSLQVELFSVFKEDIRSKAILKVQLQLGRLQLRSEISWTWSSVDSSNPTNLYLFEGQIPLTLMFVFNYIVIFVII